MQAFGKALSSIYIYITSEFPQAENPPKKKPPACAVHIASKPARWPTSLGVTANVLKHATAIEQQKPYIQGGAPQL